MPTPSIQTLRTDAQQVLNLDSISAVRSVVAATLANANAGTPLNPNLTTQQLWNEFYQIVTQPKSDIESIIANQLMKFMYAPPAPGGVGANHEVIYNNNGVLAGDSKFLWDDALNRLDIDGSATITGDLTVRTNKLAVTSTGVGIGMTPITPLSGVIGTTGAVFFRTTDPAAAVATPYIQAPVSTGFSSTSPAYGFWYQACGIGNPALNNVSIITDSAERYKIDSTGVSTWSVAGTTAMTLNSDGLLIGTTVAPAYSSKLRVQGGVEIHASQALNVQPGNTNPYEIVNRSAGGFVFYPTALVLGMTLDASGNLLVGTTSGSLHKFQKAIAVATGLFEISSSSTGSRSLLAYSADAEGWSANTPAIFIGKYSVTGRSINAGGTLNASGADYAEYMVKCSDFVLAKGDVAGIDANGKLTNVFADAISFVVKSTDPSYVGNDKWGIDLEGDALEAARQLVDRIAFAGQVPVNVTGAKAGDYIVPVVDGTGIKGISVSNPTFDQYQLAVGKVIGIDADGRARIIVKVA